MKSPFTGGDAALCHEKQSFEFRKDNFEIVYHFYRCKDTNEEFTTTEFIICIVRNMQYHFRMK